MQVSLQPGLKTRAFLSAHDWFRGQRDRLKVMFAEMQYEVLIDRCVDEIGTRDIEAIDAHLLALGIHMTPDMFWSEDDTVMRHEFFGFIDAIEFIEFKNVFNLILEGNGHTVRLDVDIAYPTAANVQFVAPLKF